MIYRVALLIAFLGAGCAARPAHEPVRPMPANVANGRAVFARECLACHGRDGSGGPVGPALRGEHVRRSAAAVRSIIVNPQMPMPKLYPAELSESDLRDVTAYVESL